MERHTRQWFLIVGFITLLSLLSVPGVGAQTKKLPRSTAPEQVDPARILMEQSTAGAAKPSHHKLPKVPLVIDNIKRPPEYIRRFEGQPLYFVLSPQAKNEGVLYAFTSHQKFRTYVDSLNVMKHSSSDSIVEPQHNDWNDVRSFFNRHDGYSGETLYVPAGYGYSDLGGVYWGGWVWQDWSDEISSVRATPRGCTYLYEDENWGGSYLLIYSGQDAPDLDVYGWS